MEQDSIKKLISNIQEEIRIFERPSYDNSKKMLEILINLAEITASDIEAWANETFRGGPTAYDTGLRDGSVKGAKAVLNGDIKHIDNG